MTTCTFISRVHLLHDGELSPEAQHALQAHLSLCQECADELASLSAFGPAFAEMHAEIHLSMIERARLETRLAKELESYSSHRPPQAGTDWQELGRTARLISAIAASILIISSVWLIEIPSRHTTTVSPAGVGVTARDYIPGNIIPEHGIPGAVPAGNVESTDAQLANSADIPAWERAALTLRVDPRPEDWSSGTPFGGTLSGLADARSMGHPTDDAFVDPLDNSDRFSADGSIADFFVTGLRSNTADHVAP